MEYFNGISYDELVIRYAHNYGLPQDSLTIDMVLRHWELEKALTKKLFESTPQNRKKVFYDAYNALYNELTWLQKTGTIHDELSAEVFTNRWLPLLGDVKGKRVYEIGSGNGNLIVSIANKGAICVGTEISESRPNKETQKNLEWHSTDGVNLTDYEPQQHYDLVISDQVIEHLHPDDIGIHFSNVYHLLKPGGRYIFYTPHYYIGPGDVSRVFGTLEAEGMHLKEYKYSEICSLLKLSGFSKIDIPVNLKPNEKSKSLAGKNVFLFLERSLKIVKSLSLRKRIYHRLIKPFHVSYEIVMIAQK
ncbi:MAG TPA: class I SAM-dependent methyltransferase [Mucilaginibacter sp.]|jgi:SAM-dependent methyltransferase